MNVVHTSDAREVVEAINRQEIRNYRWGMALLVVAVSTWIIGLELVNVVMKGDDFDKPFFIAFLTGSFFSLNLIPDVWKWKKGDEQKAADNESNLLVRPNDRLKLDSLQSLNSVNSFNTSSGSVTSIGDQTQLLRPVSNSEALSRTETVWLAAQISVVYYFYNLCTMTALRYTTPSNSTVLSASSSIFTLFGGAFLGIDTLTPKKLMCVVGSTVGVFLVTLADSPADGRSKFQSRNPILGNSLAVLGAIAYSVYLIVVEVRTSGRSCDERRLFGYVGLWTAFLGTPLLFILHVLGVEALEAPPSQTILASVVINSLFSVVSDFATILAMLLTSPLVTSLSLTSAIPITVFIDYVLVSWEQHSPQKKPIGYLLGILSILTSVVLINVNVATEEDLIEKVIDEALSAAVNDELLSPVLTPLMSPRDGPWSPKLGSSPRFGFRLSPHMSPRLLRDDIEDIALGNSRNLPLAKPRSKLYITETASEEMTVRNKGHHMYEVLRTGSIDDGEP